MPKEKKQKETYQRLISFLNRGQIDILDKIGKDALFSKGVKLSRSKIVATLVDLLLELDMDGKGISSLEELRQRVKEKIYLKLVKDTGPTPKQILLEKKKGD